MRKSKTFLLMLESEICTIQITEGFYKYEKLENLRHKILMRLKKKYPILYKKWLNYEVS